MQGKVTERRCKLTVSTSRQPGIQAGVDAPQKVFQVDLRCQYSFPTHILSTTHTTMNHCINSKFESGPDWETVQLWPMTRPVQSNAVLLIYKVPKKGFEREHSLVFLFRVTLQCHYLVSLSGVTHHFNVQCDSCYIDCIETVLININRVGHYMLTQHVLRSHTRICQLTQSPLQISPTLFAFTTNSEFKTNLSRLWQNCVPNVS